VQRERISTLDLRDLLAAAAARTGDEAPADGEADAAARPRVFEWSYRRGDGTTVATEVRLMPLTGTAGLVRASITDITERKRALTIMAGERNVFERIAADAPLQEVLAATVALAESICPDFVVSIGRLGPDGQSFVEVVGPRLPERCARPTRTAPSTCATDRARRRCILAAPCWSATCAPIRTGSGGARWRWMRAFPRPGACRSRLPAARCWAR
jgi:hypothetical protein